MFDIEEELKKLPAKPGVYLMHDKTDAIIYVGKAISLKNRVPEDISLAGYDGIDMTNYIVPSLTTIRQPVEKMAKDTTKLLFDIISGKREHQHITYPAELVIRESTRQRE